MATWMITGAARGFGLAIAHHALERGHDVVATGRSVDAVRSALGPDSDRLLVERLDVTDAEGAAAAVDAAVARFGGIDVLVNNAGNGIIGAVEEVSDDETRSVFETNVFGVLTVTRAVLPVMRGQRSGRVVMISSMGGFTQPGGGWGIYGASKFAVEGFSEALRHEVADLGITVTLVEPGSFRTDFLDGSSLRQAASRIADYDGTAGRIRDRAATGNHRQPGDPMKAAEAIVTTVEGDDPPFRLPLGSDAVAAVERKIEAVRADLRRTDSISRSTDHD